MQHMVRVELYGGATRETYDSLHASMEGASFNRFLTAEGTDEKSETLTGTYWIETSSDGMTVLERAKQAAHAVWSNVGVMVAGDGRIVYSNTPKLPSSFGAELAKYAATQPSLYGTLFGTVPTDLKPVPDFWSSILYDNTKSK